MRFAITVEEMLFTILICALSFSLLAAKDTYRAAVLEHYPIKEAHSYEDLIVTTKVYVDHIEDAAIEEVDIIVFPEDGLTASVNSEETLWASSTKLPDPTQKIAPCDDQAGGYANFLVQFSCASRKHKIYSVVNLIEAVDNTTGGRPLLYNANVVFDRNGVVIASYRKINLYDEYYYQRGPLTAVTFTTDFGVTFGMFICFDIFFQTPAEDVLKNLNVTDVVFSTSWYQQLPFFIANSVQHAYAISSGVNFLASGMSDLDMFMGGSGIYLANGEVLSAFISGKNESKLLIADVPILKPRQNLRKICNYGGGIPKNSFAPDIHLRATLPAKLENYTFTSIDLDQSSIFKTVCGSRQFCCTFSAAIRRNSQTEPNYSYKLLIYDGVSQMDVTTVGFKQCAIIACANASVESCGQRNAELPTGVYFEDLSITGTFDAIDTKYMPLTVTYDLLPANSYTFCRNASGSMVDVNMYATRATQELMTFGILGRDFKNDGKPPGAISDTATHNIGQLYVTCVIILLSANSVWVV